MGQISLTGAVILGPDVNSTGFPGAETTVPLIASGEDYAVASPAGLMLVNSPSAFVPVPGVGTNGPVTQGTLLYVRAENAMQLRLTITEGTSIVPIEGLFILEFPAADPLTLLEVKGAGRIEYLVAGQV